MHSIFSNPKRMQEFLNEISQTTCETYTLKQALEEEYPQRIWYI